MLWRRVLSYRKNDWELSDYPISILEQEFDSELKAPRFTQHRYVARIIGWYAAGSGDTREGALSALENEFAAAKQRALESGAPLCRPGVQAPVKFASQERIQLHAALSEDFIHRALELPWAFISDESSLWDFHDGDTNRSYYAKIKEVYGVDVSDIESGNVAEILERIAMSQEPERRLGGTHLQSFS